MDLLSPLVLKFLHGIADRAAPVISAAALKKWKSARVRSQAASSLRSITHAKTLLHADEAVPITSFYYPSRIVKGKNGYPVSALSEFPESHNIVLEATVGQGKSIFLRYLAIEEVRAKLRFPLLFELRRIVNFQDIDSALHSAFQTHGFECDRPVFFHLLASGYFVVFLDGFDEIPADRVASSATEIESLASRFPQCQIVVSTRPDTQITSSVHFVKIRLAPLTQSDQTPFLRKRAPTWNRK